MPHETPRQQDAQRSMKPGNKQTAIASSEAESQWRHNPAISKQTLDARGRVSTSVGRA